MVPLKVGWGLGAVGLGLVREVRGLCRLRGGPLEVRLHRSEFFS